MNFLHLTCDSRIGGINKFVTMLAESDQKSNNHYSFEAENKSTCLHQYNCPRFNLRKKKGILFIMDIILNLPFVLFFSVKANVIILHSTLLIPYAFVFFLLGKDFYFIVNDFNNPSTIIRAINLFYSSKIRFGSPILIPSFSDSLYSKRNVILPITKTYIQLIEGKSTICDSSEPDEYELSLLYIGSLSYVKGLQLFLKNLSISFIDIPITIHIIGNPEKRYLQHFPDSRLLPLNTKAIYHGKIHDERTKLSIASKCNFSLIPSISEVFPYVYGESLLYNKIPLCSSISAFTSITSLRSHIFDTKSLTQIQTVLSWSAGLSTTEYINYCKQLRYDYANFCANYDTAESFANNIISR